MSQNLTQPEEIERILTAMASRGVQIGTPITDEEWMSEATDTPRGNGQGQSQGSQPMAAESGSADAQR